MVKSKVALICSSVILVLCLAIYFSFPGKVLIGSRSTIMSFPITDQDGYILLGIIGVVLFVIAMILLASGLKKYRARTVIAFIVAYSLLPSFLTMIYQETLASGIAAVSYDENGTCNFELKDGDLMNGECNFVLHNRSNQAVSFELELIDSLFFTENDPRMESLMNIAGPYNITLEANEKKSINLNEQLDLTDVKNHINGGTLGRIHFKLKDGDDERIL